MSLKKFKELLKTSLFLENKEIELFDQIPEATWKDIFEKNFNSDIDLATNIIWNNFEDVSYDDLDKELNDIHNFKEASNLIDSYIQKNKKIIVVSDTDNDGSSAQASLLEFKSIFEDAPIDSEYWQSIPGKEVRGFSYDFVKKMFNEKSIDKNADILLVTADNGINSREEAEAINKEFPNVKILITDHHMPSESVVVENENTMIFNPKYKPNAYFEKKNISGAHTFSLLLKDIIKKNFPMEKQAIANINHISNISNQLDYVDTDIRHKPLKDYLITKFASLGNIMNVNNSSNQIVKNELDFKSLKEVFADQEDVDLKAIETALKIIKNQNVLAYSLIHIEKDNRAGLIEDAENMSANGIYNLMIENLDKITEHYETETNKNFVEQLRPYIINYEGKANKNAFELSILDSMTNIFETIKKQERAIMEELRKADLMDVYKNEHSTILKPKNTDLLKTFNRKFLTKTFNEENNGFFFVMNQFDETAAKGSMRSIYDIDLLLKNSAKFEKKHGVALSFQGHKVAAGFFMEATGNKKITEKTLLALNEYMAQEVEKLKIEEAKMKKPYILANFDGLILIDKINKKIKSHLPNTNAIEPLIRLTKDTYLTDNETTRQIHISKLVDGKKYGYKPVSLSFADQAIILPTEMIKQIARNGYKDYIQVGYMDEGAFIGHSIKSSQAVDMDNVVEIKRGEKSRRELEAYYNERFTEKNNYTVEVTREMIRELPYFKYNKYGDLEFDRFENMAINVLDESKADIIAITDTEGTGLGQAPKLFNLGAMNIKIDEESGFEVNESELYDSLYKNYKGMEVFIKDEDKDLLKRISPSQYEKYGFDRSQRCFKTSEGSIYEMPEKSLDKVTPVVNRRSLGNGKVILNRKVKYDVITFMLNENDINLTQEIINLTGIDNEFLRNTGLKTKEVDERWKEYYKGKNVIFQAHNLPYDNGIIKSNLPETTELLRESLVCDSALYSREMKLSYDKVMVAKFKGIEELNKKEFYNSPYSDFNLDLFLDGQIEMYPDRTGRFILKNENDIVRLIDIKENSEIELEESLDEIKELKYDDLMNKTSIKYSVEQLSLHETIRNMLLSSIDVDKELVLTNIPDELSQEEDLMLFFMAQYHFDSTVGENINNFNDFIRNNREDKDEFFRVNEKRFEDFAEAFVLENKKLASKFQDAWIYKKVLDVFEPSSEKTDENVVKELAYRTAFPKEIVERVLSDAWKYKKDKNVDHIIVHEAHNNIVYDKEGYGDVVLEGVLTLKRLADTTYNSYRHHTDDARRVYIKNSLETKANALKTEMGDVAVDAYSRKQAQSYTRRYRTQKVKDMINPERIRFKLRKDILPQGTFIEVENRSKKLTKTQIKDLTKKIEFVVINEIIKASNGKRDAIGEKINDMLTQNEVLVNSHKRDIRKLLGEDVTFERKRSVTDKVIDSIIDLVGNGRTKFNFKTLEKSPLNEDDFVELETFAAKYIETFNRSHDKVDEDVLVDFFNELESHNELYLNTKKEIVSAKKQDKEKMTTANILPQVTAVKRNLSKWMFTVAPDVMQNELVKITSEYQEMANPKVRKRVKRKP